MTAYQTSQTSIVTELKSLLRDRYKSGFPVFKELIQNADDACAGRIVICGHQGLSNARNPLLRAPGLIVANDGPVRQEQFDALQRSSGGTKGGDASSVGRFGLGQKAVFHLCDAFIAQARVAGPDGRAGLEPQQKILNPLEEIPQAVHAGSSWKEVDRGDMALLDRWASEHGLWGGMLLAVPLRTNALGPGGGLSLAKAEWSPQTAIAHLVNSDELAATLCCLRNISVLEIVLPEGPVHRHERSGPVAALSSPNAATGARRLGGEYKGPYGGVRFSGHETCLPAGDAASLKHRDDWPTTFDLYDQPVRADAEPHGAVLVCREGAGDGPAKLRIRNVVYLPLGDPLLEASLVAGAEHLDLLLHGHFFVSSDRRSIHAEDDSIEAHWNEALRHEATLPLLLDALADALPALPGEPERVAVLRALGQSAWWMENRAAACGGRALALTWQGGRVAQWRIVPAASLRPVPVDQATSLRRLQETIPDLSTWCEERQVGLAFGTTLAEASPCWPDDELADLVRRVGPAAFTKGPFAETLGQLLGDAPGLATRTALAEQFRLAAMDSEQMFASADRLKAIVRHLPTDRRLILPPSVDNRRVIKALAGASLPVKPGWLPPDQHNLRRLGLDETVALLAALEPLLSEKGEAGNQAARMVSHLLGNGAGLEALARHVTGKTLQVIPVTHMQSGKAERLSLEAASILQEQGLLFDSAPNRELGLLSTAIAYPAIYQLSLREGGLESCASAKRPECLVAVLRQAKLYDDPARCGELAEHLRDHAARDDLRRLVAQDNALDGEVELVELTVFGEALDRLVDELCRERRVRLVASQVANELHKVRAKIGLKALDIGQLGHWLVDALEAGILPAFGDATAQALLQSTIDDEILKRLPLHRCAGESLRFAAWEVYLGNRSELPRALAGLARLAEFWPDPVASGRQNRLIARWDHDAAIRTALGADNPARFTAEICAGLKKLPDLSADLANLLGAEAWIGTQDKSWRPGQVLDLPLKAEKAWRDLAGPGAEFLLSSELPSCLRDETVLQRLAQVLPDREQSFENALLAFAEHGGAGLCLDVAGHIADLRRLARLDGWLAGGAWPLLAAAMDTDLSDDTLVAFAGLLPEPSLASVKAQMDALAGLAEKSGLSEVGPRLHHAAFVRNAPILCQATGFLPRDLLLPNANGQFLRAEALALDVDGVARDAMLDRRYGEVLDIADSTPVHGVPVGTAARLPLDEAVKLAFAPLVEHDIGDGILLVLAMLGRGDNIRALANGWQGQTPFDRICHDLDEVSVELEMLRSTIIDRLAHLRFEASFPEGGKVEVRSAAGSLFTAPLSGQGEALLIECRQRDRTREEITAGLAVWTLVLGEVAPQGAEDAKGLLRQFVQRVAPALMLAMPVQRQALQARLDSYFASDQRPREDAEKELREVLHDRLAGIKSGHIIKSALKAYHRDSYAEQQKARDALWAVAASSEGATELLEATRNKIAEMGYRADRVLFELYQNAVDAQAQWHGESKVRVEALRDAEGAIIRLRLIHWGRPINQPGPDPRRAEDEEHGRDLANILAISHSAKDGDAVTGRFGLGFKTVHMLSDGVGIASAGVILRIVGGMIPEPWPEGEAEARPFNERGRKATLIDVPVAPDRQDEARKAWEAFRQAAPLLAALGRDGTIELSDCADQPPLTHEAEPLVDGVALVALDQGCRALRFDLDAGFRLFLPLGRNGPYAFPGETAQFWNLVPLVGISRQGAWLMEGPFPVDPGRTHFSGSPEDSARLFARLGRQLASRLMALHDASAQDGAGPAQQLGIDPDSLDSFQARLVQLFAQDLSTHEPQRHLHKGEGGLARLLAERPLVPLAFGGAICASQVSWRLDGALALPEVRDLLSVWPLLDPFRQGMIDEDTAHLLERLALPRGRALNLPTLVERSIGENGIDQSCAELLSVVLDEALRQAASKEEDQDLRRIMRERQWLAEDGSLQPIRLLAFPQSGDADEQARAAFAPASGRLAATYGEEGVKLAMFADERSGGHLDVLQAWAKTANASDDRRLAFLRYLANRASEGTVLALAKAAGWLPAASELQSSSLLDGLEPKDRNLLLLRLGCDLFPAPYPPRQVRPIAAAETVLLEIAGWWRREGPALRDAYDCAVYPQDGFCFADLEEDKDEAWFTLLALATFQTLGRIKPSQSRRFVENAMNERWWDKLPTIDPQGSNLGPFVERLRAWSEPDAREEYMIWRRCLTDLCRIARHLDDYRRLFSSLPAVIQQDGDIGLRNYLNPMASVAAGRMGIFASPLARSLGIGANWVVRELARKGFYSAAQAGLVAPYGWSTAERVRKLVYRLDMGRLDHGIDEGRLLYRAVQDLIGDETAFDGDGDLPLHVITLAKHRNELNNFLYSVDGGQWLDDGLEELDDDDA